MSEKRCGYSISNELAEWIVLMKNEADMDAGKILSVIMRWCDDVLKLSNSLNSQDDRYKLLKEVILRNAAILLVWIDNERGKNREGKSLMDVFVGSDGCFDVHKILFDNSMRLFPCHLPLGKVGVLKYWYEFENPGKWTISYYYGEEWGVGLESRFSGISTDEMLEKLGVFGIEFIDKKGKFLYEKFLKQGVL